MSVLNTPWTVKLIVTPGVEPTIEQLNIGDLCFNVADGRLFFRLLNGAITELLSTQFLSAALLTQSEADQRYQLAGTAGGARSIVQAAHGFAIGQAVCYQSPGGWGLALNSEPDRLARAMVSSVPNPDTFTIACSGEIVGSLANLQPGVWYHTSAIVPGAIVPAPAESQAIPGAYAANPLGQAVSSTDFLFLSINPYLV